MSKRIITVAAFAAVLGVNLYLRAFPAYFPQLKKAAVVSTLNTKYADFVENADKRFPGIPVVTRDRIARAEFNAFRKTHKGELADLVDQEYRKQKDRFQDKRGQTYLMELDCWHWMRYVDNVLRHGHPGDIKAGGTSYDMLMNAPEGNPIPHNHFLFYFSAWLYKIYSSLFPVQLSTFLFYLPLLFMGLFVTALFAFCLRYFGLACAFVSCLFVGLAPIFLPRSVAGWFDMDILSLLLPFLSVVCYFIAQEKQGIARIAWTLFSSFWIGLFAFTWLFWFAFAGIIIAYEGYTLLNLLSEKLQYKTPVGEQLRAHWRSLALFVPASVLFVLAFSGIAPFAEMFKQVALTFHLNEAVVAVWPNVFSTVSELKRPDFLSIGRSVGDLTLFYAALGSMLAFLLLNHHYRGVKREAMFLFVIWFMAMFLVCSKGTRFIMFLLVPLGIALGWGVEEAFAFTARRGSKTGMAAVSLFLMFIAFVCVETGYKIALNVYPLMDDQWYSLLTAVKTTTPPRAVVNSWWDYGDWFKAAADRPVIFDGQSQDTPRAYWMARALLTGDEKEAVGILRMLNNGGNKAFDLLDRKLKDPFRSLALLKSLVVLDREAGRRRIAVEGLRAEDAARLEGLLYDIPADAYFIVDSSMLMKMPSISFIGNWDSAKVYLAKNIARKSSDEITAYLQRVGMTKQDGAKLLQEAQMMSASDLSGWISRNLFFHGSFGSGLSDEGLVFFDNGSVYNPGKRKFYLYDARERVYKTPKSLFAVSNDEIEETPYPGSDMDISAVVFSSDTGYRLALMNEELGKSLFFRLYFLHGNGLSHFRLFAIEKDVASVYKITWQ